MQNDDEAMPSISPAGIVQLEKNAHNSLTTWYSSIRFCILIHFNIDIDMLNGDEASPSISLANFYHLVKDRRICDKTSIYFKRSSCFLSHFLVQIQIIAKLKVISILF